MKKRILGLITALSLAVSMIPALGHTTVKAATFPDLPSDWSTSALENAVKNQLLYGSDGLIQPDGVLTRAQMAAILNRSFGSVEKADTSGFKDIPSDKWYANDMALALKMGTIVGNGDGTMTPDVPITREQAFSVLARAFAIPDGEKSSLSKFRDAGELSDYAKGAVAGLSSNGYLAGLPSIQTEVKPKAPITRAEFAKVMDNLVKEYITKDGEYSKDIAGNVLINKSGVTLKDMNIKGDLILADGVAEGDIRLKNVTVSGKTLVRGGGKNSIYVEGSTKLKGGVVAHKMNPKPVSLKIEGDNDVEIVSVLEGNLIITGRVKTLDVADNVTVTVHYSNIGDIKVTGNNSIVSVGLASSVNKVVISGANSSVNMNCTVKEVVVEASATNSKINADSNAKIEAITVNATKVIINGKGEVVKVFATVDDITVTVPKVVVEDASKKPSNTTAQATPTPTPPTSSGSTGSDSGSSSSPETATPPSTPPSAPPTDAPVSNRQILAGKIEEAKGEKGSVKVSVDGSDVLKTDQWVSQDAMNALENAIAECESILENAKYQREIDDAATMLQAALIAFVSAKQNGTNNGPTLLYKDGANGIPGKAFNVLLAYSLNLQPVFDAGASNKTVASYELVNGVNGISIDQTSGQITVTGSSMQAGDSHIITVNAKDSDGETIIGVELTISSSAKEPKPNFTIDLVNGTTNELLEPGKYRLKATGPLVSDPEGTGFSPATSWTVITASMLKDGKLELRDSPNSAFGRSFHIQKIGPSPEYDSEIQSILAVYKYNLDTTGIPKEVVSASADTIAIEFTGLSNGRPYEYSLDDVTFYDVPAVTDGKSGAFNVPKTAEKLYLRLKGAFVSNTYVFQSPSKVHDILFINPRGKTFKLTSASATSGWTYKAVATVFDQFGDPMPSEVATFALKTPVQGITINQATGDTTIASTVPVGTKFTVVATSLSSATSPNVFTAELDVTVKNSLTTFELKGNVTTGDVPVARTKQLEVMVEPAGADKRVIWTSSDSSIAEVNIDGIITGMATGTATITGVSKVDSSKTVTFNVTVSAEPQRPAEPSEMRAVWVSFLEYSDARPSESGNYMPIIQGQTPTQAMANIDEAIANIKGLGLNTVILHAISHADAHYNSTLFPSSVYSSMNPSGIAKQGDRDMTGSWDPFGYFVNKATSEGLEVHAWFNPYRIGVTRDKLAENHIALQWLDSTDPVAKDNVITTTQTGSTLAFNPARTEVMDYIVSGIQEVIDKYGDKLTAIHMDDYFYPTTADYIDQMAYDEYVLDGGTMSKKDWRFDNVNRLVKKIYNAVHNNTKNSNLVFGLSPQGNYDNNYTQQFADVTTWVTKPGYVDYIVPQLYWGFKHSSAPFARLSQEWVDRVKLPNVSLYIGLGVYRIGTKDGSTAAPYEWRTDTEILKRMIETTRTTSSKVTAGIGIKGVMLFDYRTLFRPSFDAVTHEGITFANLKALTDAEVAAIKSVFRGTLSRTTVTFNTTAKPTGIDASATVSDIVIKHAAPDTGTKGEAKQNGTPFVNGSELLPGKYIFYLSVNITGNADSSKDGAYRAFPEVTVTDTAVTVTVAAGDWEKDLPPQKLTGKPNFTVDPVTGKTKETVSSKYEYATSTSSGKTSITGPTDIPTTGWNDCDGTELTLDKGLYGKYTFIREKGDGVLTSSGDAQIFRVYEYTGDAVPTIAYGTDPMVNFTGLNSSVSSRIYAYRLLNADNSVLKDWADLVRDPSITLNTVSAQISVTEGGIRAAKIEVRIKGVVNTTINPITGTGDTYLQLLKGSYDIPQTFSMTFDLSPNFGIQTTSPAALQFKENTSETTEPDDELVNEGADGATEDDVVSEDDVVGDDESDGEPDQGTSDDAVNEDEADDEAVEGIEPDDEITEGIEPEVGPSDEEPSNDEVIVE